MSKPELILTCEHAGNLVPREWLEKVSIPHQVLDSHRGWDPGALEITEELKKVGAKAIYVHRISRLLIELNRSLSHKQLFSEYCKKLTPRDRQSLIESIYLPYREQVERAIKAQYDGGNIVWHVSVHTFTPVLGEVEREAEIGLLYDPARPSEKSFSAAWQGLLKDELGEECRVRMNYPYRGISDGFVTALRKFFPSDRYVGIELEVNQGLQDDSNVWKSTVAALRKTLSAMLNNGVKA